MCIYIYIYIYIEREREGERERDIKAPPLHVRHGAGGRRRMGNAERPALTGSAMAKTAFGGADNNCVQIQVGVYVTPVSKSLYD